MCMCSTEESAAYSNLCEHGGYFVGHVLLPPLLLPPLLFGGSRNVCERQQLAGITIQTWTRIGRIFPAVFKHVNHYDNFVSSYYYGNYVRWVLPLIGPRVALVVRFDGEPPLRPIRQKGRETL